jgi:hypothetical protein
MEKGSDIHLSNFFENKILICDYLEKLPYPKSVLFILTHQVFERFSFWGIVGEYLAFNF